MYHDSDYIMLSAIQHYAFCPRQCALIHKEQLWAENYHTSKGELFHNRVDNYPLEKRKNYHREFSMRISSQVLGVVGQSDLVEVLYEHGKVLEMIPVEYKSGKQKEDSVDKVQLCAQALCLEEMTDITIPEGYLYYGKEHRRLRVQLTNELREETVKSITSIHEMLQKESLPQAINSEKCKYCSLADFCLPKIVTKEAGSYIENYLNSMDKENAEVL